MAILVKGIQKKNPLKPMLAPKWYPVQNSTGIVGEEEVAKLLTEETTLNPLEAEMAVRQLDKVVARLLKEGHTVRLGNLGIFNITLSTTGEDTREKLAAKNIKQVKINFAASDEFKAELQKAEFVWIDKLVPDAGECTPVTPPAE